MILSIMPIGKFYPRSVILLIKYRLLGEDTEKHFYTGTTNFLIIIVWNTLPRSSMHKIPSIMPSGLHCITGIKVRYSFVLLQSRNISLRFLERVMEICAISIPFSKQFKTPWINTTWLLLEIFNSMKCSSYSQVNVAMKFTNGVMV